MSGRPYGLLLCDYTFFSVSYIQEKRNNERNPHSIGICK